MQDFYEIPEKVNNLSGKYFYITSAFRDILMLV